MKYEWPDTLGKDIYEKVKDDRTRFMTLKIMHPFAAWVVQSIKYNHKNHYWKSETSNPTHTEYSFNDNETTVIHNPYIGRCEAMWAYKPTNIKQEALN